MNFANLEQSEITLYGQGNNDVTMKFPVPPELQYTLMTKRIGIQDMEIDTQSFPRFIPQLLWYNFDINTYYAGSNDDSRIGNEEDKDVLGYFFVIRKNDNSKACVSYVQWSNPNNITNYISLKGPDPRSIYLTPYYYCYNFMDFLDMCQSAIVAGLTNVIGSAPTAVPTFLFYPLTQTFKMTIPQTLGDEYNIEMSSSLKDLFNFQTQQINLGFNAQNSVIINANIITYQIVWTNVGTVEDDYNASCRISNNIYPFDLYMLECSTLPINPMTFVSTRTRIFNGADLSKKIIKRWRNQYDMLDRYTSLALDTEEQTDKLRPMSKNKLDDNVLSFVLWVRTKREQEYLEWTLPQGQQIKFLLNTYALV